MDKNPGELVGLGAGTDHVYASQSRLKNTMPASKRDCSPNSPPGIELTLADSNSWLARVPLGIWSTPCTAWEGHRGSSERAPKRRLDCPA